MAGRDCNSAAGAAQRISTDRYHGQPRKNLLQAVVAVHSASMLECREKYAKLMSNDNYT